MDGSLKIRVNASATAGAIANAFFDATGVHMPEFPLTPRVLAALQRGWRP